MAAICSSGFGCLYYGFFSFSFVRELFFFGVSAIF